MDMHDLSEVPHSGDLRKGRVSLDDHSYFITKCVHHAVDKPLIRPMYAKLVVSSIIWAKKQGWWRILGFVIMPDHYHAIVGLRSARRLSSIMESINKYTARRLNGLFQREGPFWQDGFYEHLVRDRKDYDNILAYVHNNPVEAGLVDSPDAWEYSTAYAEYADEIDWEWLGPTMPEIRDCKHRFAKENVPPRYW